MVVTAIGGRRSVRVTVVGVGVASVRGRMVVRRHFAAGERVRRSAPSAP